MMFGKEFFADYNCLTSAEGLLSANMEKTIVTYDMFFRELPDSGGFAVMSGLQQLIEKLSDISFSEEELKSLREQGFSEALIEYLGNFEFSCDVYAMPEGTPVFPNEPIVKVQGPAIQAQLIETLLLNTINHQTLIATKANRVVRAAQGRRVFESGARRAHGFDAAIYGARAAFVGGVNATTLYPASKKAVRQKVGMQLIKMYISCAITVMFLLMFADMSVYYSVVVLATIYVIIDANIHKALDKLEFQLLNEMLSFIENVKFKFQFDGMIEEALLDAINEGNYQISIHGQLIYNYLREDSSWYKQLNRGEDVLKTIEQQAKKFYKQTPEDKIEKLSRNIELISTFIDVIKE